MKKPLNTLVSLLLALVVLLPMSLKGQNLSDLSFGTDSTFDVLTWNIEWFPKRGTATVDSVSKIIRSLEADLLALQEIDDTNLCRQMINNLPDYGLFMDDVWFGGLAYVYNKRQVTVNAIYKIYDTSPYWNIFPRSPLVIELSFQGERIIVINNHYKCCGDGILVPGNPSDEEYRRYRANQLLKNYLDTHFASDQVILLGDLNDLLTDASPNNVFEMFLVDTARYLFADYGIAAGPVSQWSFPNWPSHLDHILINQPLFSAFAQAGSGVETLRIDDYMAGGFSNYDYYISDHRPVAMKLNFVPLTFDSWRNTRPLFAVYPNPSSGPTRVDLSPWEGALEVQVRDLKGRLIQSIPAKGKQSIAFQIEGPPGMYLLQVRSSKGYTSQKLIKR